MIPTMALNSKETNFDKPQNEDDWYVPDSEDDGSLTFDVSQLYTPDQFLKIVRVVIGSAIKAGEAASVIEILEIWEKRVISVDQNSEESSKPLVGFTQDANGIIRIYFTIDVSKF